MLHPRKEVGYAHRMGSGVVRRVRFVKQRGKIIEFVAQLECLLQDEWHVVVRYDTVHNFAHCDVLHPDGSQEKTALPFDSLNEAMTFALSDLEAHWRVYRERYERWLEE